MDKKVIASFHMTVYNCEKYIESSLKSIINQTEKRWILAILDNGSTDKTRKIIQNYAEKDDRIIFWYIDENKDFSSEEFLTKREIVTERVQRVKPEFFAVLDADDIYNNNFLKKSYELATKYNVDMVLSGTVMFYDENDSIAGVRIPPTLELIEQQIEPDDFMRLYGSLRPVWGKLISSKYAAYFHRECVSDIPSCIGSAQDTYRILKLLNEIKSFSCIGETLHYYRIRHNSDSRGKVIPISRIDEGIVLHQLGSIVAKKYRAWNKNTETFLSEILYNHIKDAVDLVRKSNAMKIDEKFIYYNNVILSHEFIKKISTVGKKTDLAKLLYSSIIESIEKEAHNNYEDILNIYTATENLLIKDIIEFISEELNNSETTLHTEFKSKILELIDSNNLEIAKQLNDSILVRRSLDGDAMYFDIYLSYINKQTDWQIKVLKGLIFMANNENIMDLCHAILSEETKYE